MNAPVLLLAALCLLPSAASRADSAADTIHPALMSREDLAGKMLARPEVLASFELLTTASGAAATSAGLTAGPLLPQAW